ncbi:hypothetical protein VTI28DRAFT_3931 [Corynascus sepedonium]
MGIVSHGSSTTTQTLITKHSYTASPYSRSGLPSPQIVTAVLNTKPALRPPGKRSSVTERSFSGVVGLAEAAPRGSPLGG